METQKLQKVLAQAGLGSRRLMEKCISRGEVYVDGKLAKLGQRVTGREEISLNGELVKIEIEPKARVLLYHKPTGVIVARKDPLGRPNVFTNLPLLKSSKWLSVGRLDFNTSGLLLFTNSGDIANRLMHPRFNIEREYWVKTRTALNGDQKRRLKHMVILSDGEGIFKSLQDLKKESSLNWYDVIVTEGRNRFIRRMIKAVGTSVVRLKRVRFGHICLPDSLGRGDSFELPPNDVAKLIKRCCQENL